MEGRAFTPTSSNYYGHQNYPHFTVANVGGEFRSWQHISIRRAARALRNMSGGVQTNRAGVIQIEVVGYAVKPFTNDPVLVEGLSKLMRWLESETDIPCQSGLTFLKYPDSYGQSRVRFTPHQWNSFRGWCGHQHVPENTHGDPGAINIDRLLKPSEEEEKDDMFEYPYTQYVKDLHQFMDDLKSGGILGLAKRFDDLAEEVKQLREELHEKKDEGKSDA